MLNWHIKYKYVNKEWVEIENEFDFKDEKDFKNRIKKDFELCIIDYGSMKFHTKQFWNYLWTNTKIWYHNFIDWIKTLNNNWKKAYSDYKKKKDIREVSKETISHIDDIRIQEISKRVINETNKYPDKLLWIKSDYETYITHWFLLLKEIWVNEKYWIFFDTNVGDFMKVLLSNKEYTTQDSIFLELHNKVYNNKELSQAFKKIYNSIF